MLVLALVALISVAGMAGGSASSIKITAKKAYINMPPTDKKEFETDNSCCGFDVITEGASEGCQFKIPCGVEFVKDVEKYPKLAMNVALAGAAVVVKKIT